MSSTLMDMTYTYSATQNNGQISQSVDAVTGETIVYQCDALKRLSTASGQNWGENYTYDGFGNLTQMSPSGTAGAPTLSTTVDANTNRLTPSGGYAYDNNGNLTYGFGNVYGYDAANRMISVELIPPGAYYHYGYDSSNQRIYYRSSSNAETIYFYGADGKKLGTCTVTSVTNTAIQVTQQSANVYFGGRLVSAEGHTVSVDRLGSVRNGGASGLGYQAQFPYGVEYTTTVNDREKYATYTRDGLTGLDYAKRRYYSSIWGRFLSPDASRRGIDPRDPVTWNRYAYSGGDPVNKIDPSGKCQQPTGLSQGQIGVCVGTFIGTPTVPGGTFGFLYSGLGNDRGPDPSGGSFKDQFEITFDPSAGSIEVLSQVGESVVNVLGGTYQIVGQGQFAQLSVNYYIDPNGNAQVSIVASATNAFASVPFAPTAQPINLSVWLTITPGGQTSVNQGSSYSGYPSLEIWSYQQGQDSQQLLSMPEGSISSLGTWNTPIPPSVANPDGGGGGGGPDFAGGDGFSDEDNDT